MGDSSWLRTQSVKAKTEEEEARLADAVPMAHIFPVVLNGCFLSNFFNSFGWGIRKLLLRLGVVMFLKAYNT